MLKGLAFCNILVPREASRLEGHTYQLDSPVGLDLRPLKRALKDSPKTPLEGSLSVLALASSGVVSPALGPASQGCPLDR